MATLSRTPYKLFQKVQFLPVLTRNISYVRCNKTSRRIFTTCACVFGGGIMFYTVNKYRIKNVVYALKAKVSRIILILTIDSIETVHIIGLIICWVCCFML